MTITIKQVEKLAELARLELSENQKQKYTKQLNVILEYVDQLNELNTDGVEPMSHPLDITNVFREDKVQPSLPVEEVLKNAPEKTGNYFKVPKVITK